MALLRDQLALLVLLDRAGLGDARFVSGCHVCFGSIPGSRVGYASSSVGDGRPSAPQTPLPDLTGSELGYPNARAPEGGNPPRCGRRSAPARRPVIGACGEDRGSVDDPGQRRPRAPARARRPTNTAPTETKTAPAAQGVLDAVTRGQRIDRGNWRSPACCDRGRVSSAWWWPPRGRPGDSLVIYTARSHYGEEQPFQGLRARDRRGP